MNTAPALTAWQQVESFLTQYEHTTDRRTDAQKQLLYQYHAALCCHLTKIQGQLANCATIWWMCNRCVNALPSVLWHCWLDVRKSIRLCYNGPCSNVRYVGHSKNLCLCTHLLVYGPADATATLSSLVSLSPVYTIQPVVKPVWQQIVSCIQTFTRLTTGLTTSCIVYTAGC